MNINSEITHQSRDWGVNLNIKNKSLDPVKKIEPPPTDDFQWKYQIACCHVARLEPQRNPEIQIEINLQATQ